VLVIAMAVLGARVGAQPVCDVGGFPDLAACSVPVGPSETQALQRVACLLEAFNRWKLQAITCLQGRIDAWQASVMWPASGLRQIGGALRRLRTLREEVEDLGRAGWVLDSASSVLAETLTTPQRTDRARYEAVWGASIGTGRDVQDLLAWHSTLTRNILQGRTHGEHGRSGELPEATWERIGREGAALIDAERDPLSAIRYTPQLVADRLRVEASTAEMHAQALVTAQLRRDVRRWQRARATHLGALMLATLTGGQQAAPGYDLEGRR
jgi:hypothetical protein